MMRQMVQLLRCARHMPFKLGLMSAQLRLRACDLIRHGVEGFRKSSISADPPRGARAARLPAVNWRVARGSVDAPVP